MNKAGMEDFEKQMELNMEKRRIARKVALYTLEAKERDAEKRRLMKKLSPREKKKMKENIAHKVKAWEAQFKKKS